MEIKNIQIIQQILDAIEMQFGSRCAVVFYSLEESGYKAVDVRNGHLIGKEKNDPYGDVGIQISKGIFENGCKHQKITYTPEGRIFRGIERHITVDGDEIGVLELQLDITDTIRMEKFLKEYNMYEVKKEPSSEPVSLNLHQLLNRLMAEAFTSIGKSAAEMKRGDKIQFIRHLDEQGAFDITKSSERVAEALNISKCTFYNYLDKARIK